MKKDYLNLLLLQLLFYPTFAQTCGNDSIAISWSIQNYNWTQVNNLQVDSFDLPSGVVYRRIEIDTSGIHSPTQVSQSFFERRMISYNSNMDTTNFLLLTGNGSGYDNKKKIDFNYNSSHLPLSRIESNWNGTTWDIHATKSWLYDANDRIVGYTETDSIGNVLNKIYSYSGGQDNSLTFQRWTGTNWVDSLRYLYTYDLSGVKDSLMLQSWDDSASVWSDSLAVPFTIFGGWSALLTQTVVGPTSIDQYDYYVDTLGNFICINQTDLLTFNGVSNYFRYAGGHLQLVDRSVWNDTATLYYDYYYDNHGKLIRTRFSGFSSFSSFDYGLEYDSLYRPKEEYRSIRYSSNDSTETHIMHRYADSSAITILHIPMNNYFEPKCEGDSLKLRSVVAGGCGPYNFSWSPSTMVFPPSAQEPYVILNDTTSYTFTVTDSAGNSSSVLIDAYSDLSVDVIADTSCVGCPVALTAICPPSLYQWYRNDTLIPGATQQSYTATVTGTYKVMVSRLFNNCIAFSDPFYVFVSGIKDPPSVDISIFPNPSSNKIFLRGLAGKFTVTLTDIAGRTVNASLINGPIDFLDIRLLPAGIYFIRVISDNDYFVKSVFVTQSD